MATKKTQVVVEIKTDSTQATTEANKTKEEVAGIGKAAAGSIAELKELKKALRNASAGSEEFKQLSAQIRDVEDGIENAKVGANDFAGALENAGGPVGMLGKGIRQLEILTSSWGAALKATGIGLLVGLVGALGAAFAKNEDAMKKLDPIITQFGRILNGILGAMEPLINAFINLAERALPYVSEGFKVAYSALSSFLQGIGMVGSAVKKFISGDFAGAWDDAKKSVTEFGTRYEEANKRFIAGSKELTDKEKEEQAKRLADQKAAAEKREAEALKAQEKEQALLLKSYEDYLKRREFARKNLEGITRADMKANALQDIADAEKKDEELDNLNLKWQNKALASVKQNGAQILAIDQANADARAKLTNEERNLRVNAAYDIADASMALGAIIGEQTKAGKALGVASALINTYIGASEVIRAKSVLPEPFGTIQKIASVAGIIATGIKSVKSIMSVQVPSVRGASGGGASMPSIPSMNISAPLMAQASTTTLNQGQINQIGNVAARAYVVESDISGNQERVMRLNRAARIN
jgi:ribosomal protein S13